MKEEWFEDPPTNLVDLFEDSVKKFPNRPWLGELNDEGKYEWITYKEASKRVDNLRSGLAQIGIKKDDAVGLIINNSIDWAIIAFATYGLGARLIPMYQKELEKVWRYIVEDGGIKVLFVVDNEVYEKTKHYKDEIQSLENIYLIQGEGENTMSGLEKLGSENPVPSIKPHWSDIAGLIYTSGTTGDPKGVLLSHGNFATNVKAAHLGYPDVSEKDRSYSILPWAHSFGQTAELNHGTYAGASIALMKSLDNLTTEIAIAQPTLLIAVPRIFNKVYAGIHNKLEEEGKAHLLELAKDTAAKIRNGEKPGFKGKLISSIVFKKIKKLFGGKLRYAITGSAVMNPEIGQFFIDVGIPTFDCYGLTETSPALTMNTPASNKLGSVGRAIKDVTVVIDKSRVGEDSEDGEIICFGPNVMQGYHNKPQKSAEVFVEDEKLGRGLRTGDRGRLDEDGFLYITGRFKEEYKLENGKYVHPASIEEELKLAPHIANAMVFGDGKPYNVGIIFPDFEALQKYAKEQNISFNDHKALIKEANVQRFLADQATQQLKGNFGGYEIPKKWIFIDEDFSLENGMLTQTMKLKRRNVLKTYGDQLNSLYK
ncbi:MAG: AMP-dependent synthetase/ligase [Promethearchaeota archaeon]|nr:MAG: AMP-dependent synthetase/ligase [Candidatus Lokiarchaeota archaeon]